MFALAAAGHSRAEIARQTGVSHHAVSSWLRAGRDTAVQARGRRRRAARPCDAWSCSLPRSVPSEAYAYLLGLYPGDGTITRHPRHVYRLWIYCDASYPAIISEAAAAMRTVIDRKVGFVRKEGAVGVNAYSQHWPCLFPQHGPGRKHERPIVLAPWQEEIAQEHPEPLLRGLIHSDGCRDLNPVNGKEYPRYSFSNRSDEVRRIFTDACDRLGIRWRRGNRWTIAIARRPDVELLDSFIGPKS